MKKGLTDVGVPIKWLKEKVNITLTRKEMFDLANIVADVKWMDYNNIKLRDKELKKILMDKIKEDHKIWLKVIHSAGGLKKI